MHEIKTKKTFVREISEIRVRILRNEEIRAGILNEERNLCTNLNKPTKLYQDRDSKTSSFNNYLVGLKCKSVKIISEFSVYNYVR